MAEDPVMVDVPGHPLRDDGVTVGDWVARSLKPWTGDQAELWKHRKKVTRPVFQKVKNDHLSWGYAT